MTKKRPTNVAASVRARLLQLAKQGGEDFHYVLTRYGLERLLVRLMRSPHLRSMVADALRGLERPHQVGPDEIRRLARAFIRVFDTVPVYRGMLGNDAHPQWLRLLRAKRFLGLPLRTDIPGGQLAAEVLANARRAFVEDQPEQYGLPAS